MDGKTLLLFVILPLCLFAGLAYLAMDSWKDIRQTDFEIQKDGSGPAAPGQPPVLAVQKEVPVGAPELVAQGKLYEESGEWATALEKYNQALSLQDEPVIRAKAAAMEQIQLARTLESEQKWAQAAEAYKLARPDCANPGLIDVRMEYCRNAVPYVEAYQQGQAAMEAGDWDKALAAFKAARDAAERGGILTDAPALIDRVVGKQRAEAAERERVQLKGRMLGALVHVLQAEGKNRALLLACDYYAASPQHGAYAASITAAREGAQTAVEADRAAAPPPEERKVYDLVTKTNGVRYRGKILDKGELVWKFQVMEPGRKSKMMIAARAVAKAEQVEVAGAALRNELALERFYEAVAAAKADDMLAAAEALGRLCIDHSDAAFVADEAQQRRLIGDELPQRADTLGDTLAAMRTGVVALAESQAAAKLGLRVAKLPPGMAKAFVVSTEDVDRRGNPAATRDGERIDLATGFPYEAWLVTPPMEFVLVLPGEFTMGGTGNAREMPAHPVRITRPYYIGKYEVTQGQWEEVTKQAPWSGHDGMRLDRDHPAGCTSWDAACQFVQALDAAVDGCRVRLPTEAEWEYACRAGSEGSFCYGSGFADLRLYGWYQANTVGKGEPYPHRVGLKLPNAWGISDMHGNVWEWCSDWYGPYSSELQVDPIGPAIGTQRVQRGGGSTGPPERCTSTNRIGNSPNRVHPELGLRIVVDFAASAPLAGEIPPVPGEPPPQ